MRGDGILATYVRATRARRALLWRRLERTVAALAIVVFAVTTLVAGQRYFYCTQMEEVCASRCCGKPATAEGADGVDVTSGTIMRDDGCCESRHFNSPGTSRPSPDRVPLQAPLAGAVVSRPDLPRRGVSPLPRLAPDVRARSACGLAPRLRCMVFLT